jgi:competence protein ComEC
MLRLWSEIISGIAGDWVRSLPSLLVRWSLWALELALIGAVAEMVMVLGTSNTSLPILANT